jgi:hypothetical protein
MILSVVATALAASLIGVPVSSNSAPAALTPAAQAALISVAEVANIYLLEELRIQKEITGFQGKRATASGLPKSENTRLSANLAKRIKAGYAEQRTLSDALKSKNYDSLLRLFGDNISWDAKSFNSSKCKAATAYDDRLARHDSIRQRVVAKEESNKILKSNSPALEAIRAVDKIKNAASSKVRKSGEAAVAKVLTACGFKF